MKLVTAIIGAEAAAKSAGSAKAVSRAVSVGVVGRRVGMYQQTLYGSFSAVSKRRLQQNLDTKVAKHWWV